MGVVQVLAQCANTYGLLMSDDVVQFLIVRPIKPFINRLGIHSDSKTMVGWRLAQNGT